MVRKFLARRADWTDKVRLALVVQNGDGSMSYAGPISLVRAESEHDSIDPFADLSHHEAQFLMDQLWDCGLRPTEGSGSAGSLAATQKHLEDMRALVFKLTPK